MSRVISVRVPETLFENIEELSRKLKKKRSEIILEALTEGLKVLATKLEQIQKIKQLVITLEKKDIRLRKTDISIVDIISSERE